jgi:hypothetical protein
MARSLHQRFPSREGVYGSLLCSEGELLQLRRPVHASFVGFPSPNAPVHAETLRLSLRDIIRGFRSSYASDSHNQSLKLNRRFARE